MLLPAPRRGQMSWVSNYRKKMPFPFFCWAVKNRIMDNCSSCCCCCNMHHWKYLPIHCIWHSVGTRQCQEIGIVLHCSFLCCLSNPILNAYTIFLSLVHKHSSTGCFISLSLKFKIDQQNVEHCEEKCYQHLAWKTFSYIIVFFSYAAHPARSVVHHCCMSRTYQPCASELNAVGGLHKSSRKNV